MNRDAKIVWRPSEEAAVNTRLGRFINVLGLRDYDELVSRADADPAWFWDALIRDRWLQFIRPYEKILDTSSGTPWARWCVGGTTNICLNALGRHLASDIAERKSIVWESEGGEIRQWTYRELYNEVRRIAAGLRGLGLGSGDAVGIYMAMVPETIAAYLAIAWIGAISVPLFSGFGAEAIAARLNDAEAVAVIATDGGWRRGEWVGMKPTLDQALGQVPSVRSVVIVPRDPSRATYMTAGRDVDIREFSSGDDQVAEVDAEHPLMIIYTSGTTGKPKGTVHTHCGFAAKMALDMELCFDLGAGDRIFWMSDMGWLVGPMLAVGATQAGATIVLAEGAPDWPEPARYWRLVQTHAVTALGLAPTLVRSLMRHGLETVSSQDFSALRMVLSTGEVWTTESWSWLFDNVCRRKVPILNYSGGTEVGGGILTGTLLHPLKPCSFGAAVPGMGAAIVNERGEPVGRGEVGELVLRIPSIGNTRGLWRDPERYLDTYWRRIEGLWVHGDFASIDQDGFWFIHGRSDDTIKVAGKRVGPAEVEGLLFETGLTVEAAAIAIPDRIKGSSVVCVCALSAAGFGQIDVRKKLGEAVTRGLGSAFRPHEILIVPDLPKTRNMKIMRRAVRAAYLGQPLGDLSAIVNPEAIEGIRAAMQVKSG